MLVGHTDSEEIFRYIDAVIANARSCIYICLLLL
jgi:hypothetical protein